MMRLLQKLKGRLSEPADRVHLNVFRYHLATYRQPDVHARAMARAARRLNLSVSELAAGDHAALDEITSIDEWRIGKEWSLKLLGEGWRCYLARHDGHIVSIIWTIVGKTFRDDRLERTLTLAPDEAYFGRGFTIPEFRGRGVISVLGAHAIRDLTDSGVRQGTAL
ncbi:MAG TPA: hypothetical protein VE967_09330, partial [Gemmatimonadaceae bacterium]|nr:hypothetical protein [Gemmatimonadaceae bacterium]